MLRARIFSAIAFLIAAGAITAPSLPVFVNAQSITDNVYNGAQYGYTFILPKDWKTFETHYSNLKGGKVDRLLLTQYTDLVSDPTKYFLIYTGTPEAVFGVSSKVVRKVSNDYLVDFYIDQMINSSVDYRITRTATTGVGADKTYFIEANYAVPGSRFNSKVQFRFKDGKAYMWSITWRDGFANYLQTLQSVADSVSIR